ncbi:MAG TPA: hypothetical protein VF306_14825 [Pirellulales bacterium]
MATAEKWAAYAAILPDIYREILAAFPRIEPNRRPRSGLAYQSIWAEFEERELGISLGELMQACEQLSEHGFIEIKRGMFVHPTETGEELIRAVTGHEASEVSIPTLPPPPH